LNWQFQYPEAFWLIILVPFFVLLFFFYRLWQKRTIKKVGDPRLVKNLFKEHSPAKGILKIALLMVAFTLGCMALSNPRQPDESSGEARKGIDIIVALDVSNSMKATDIAPNRLARAKQFVSKIIDNLQDDRLGLVIFAGHAYAQMPLTFDREAARMYVSAADPSAITAQGTSISDALAKCNILFGDQSERFQSIILITDGETHDDNAEQTAKELAAKGIMINTVGIGSPQGTTIADTSGITKRDAAGNVVISKLNEQLLQQIASATRGTYVHLQSSEAAAKEVLAQYTNIDKKALGDTSLMNFKTYYAWLAAPMLLLLIAETFIPDRKKVKS
jgi:Ca-activated chloride channel family protein